MSLCYFSNTARLNPFSVNKFCIQGENEQILNNRCYHFIVIRKSKIEFYQKRKQILLCHIVIKQKYCNSTMHTAIKEQRKFLIGMEKCLKNNCLYSHHLLISWFQINFVVVAALWGETLFHLIKWKHRWK